MIVSGKNNTTNIFIVQIYSYLVNICLLTYYIKHFKEFLNIFLQKLNNKDLTTVPNSMSINYVLKTAKQSFLKLRHHIVSLIKNITNIN